ncbi:pseudouridine synthase [candidate division KSB1 bacterium]|nr:pseudouridine synthase [candidate division KSB1 bacterium]
MFHKPKGVVVTRHDERSRRTVYDALPRWILQENWLPVGRLDRDSRGLLLFTQDGHLLEVLTQPHRLSKTYEVWIRGRVTEDHVAQMKSGVTSKGELLCAESIALLGGVSFKSRLKIVLTEGKNRHIRRMMAELTDPMHHTPLKVLDLKRTGFGSLELDIPSGAWRFLNEEELNRLLSAKQ